MSDTEESTQPNPDEPVIKDPIYDIMDDDEAQEAFDRLMELAEEKQADQKTDEE